MSSLPATLLSRIPHGVKQNVTGLGWHATMLAAKWLSLTVASSPSKLGAESYLLATKRGLFHLEESQLTPLMPGEFYGLARSDGHWYAFRKLAEHGRILRFGLEGERISEVREFPERLSPGCHQIDFVDGELHVTDTYNNAIRVFQPGERRLVEKRHYLPAGPLDSGRSSRNYAHLNSLWCRGDERWAVFHNETQKTGRTSEIVALGDDFTIRRRIGTSAANAHNVMLLDGKPLYCDSGNGSLLWGDEVVFKCNWFTRGLSVTSSRILVGGSAYGERKHREQLAGAVFVLDRDFRLLEQVDAPGMVQEIRCVSQFDEALSYSG